MDIILLLKALVMGIVEGLTEFLPVSSTGHLILAGALLQFNGDKAKVFEIFIQTGAILAVCWEYRRKLWELRGSPTFALNIAVAFLPLAILGLAFGKWLKAHLFQPVPVALAFIVGGCIILWAERRKHTVRIDSVDAVGWRDALLLGLCQALALIPGTSRSGATIIGGLFLGLSRRTAAEFSFFLAIPTLTVAGLYDLYKSRNLLQLSDLPVFSVGFIAAFVSAFLCVRWLVRYISRHDFTLFAWYRIGFGILILATAYFGLVSWQ